MSPDSALDNIFEGAVSDVHRLLDPGLVKYPSWETEIADKKVFYVRGFTWFRRTICRNITELADKAHMKKMKDLLAEREKWLGESYPWDETFGWKQAYEASKRYNKGAADQREVGEFAKRKSNENNCVLKFHKAVLTILLCEAVAHNLKKDHRLVYKHMRIQPACSYIHGFDSDTLARLRAADPEFNRKLRAATGQRDNGVFDEMAVFKRVVTHQLATRTHLFLTKVAGADLGDVDFRLNGRFSYPPSVLEEIDVPVGDGSLLALPWETSRAA